MKYLITSLTFMFLILSCGDDEEIEADTTINTGDCVVGNSIDSDCDGVLDTEDNCPLIANADQLDTDGDGEGDVCDTDDDGDGVLDTEDNCPLIANADQLDNDSDCDGVANAQDYWPNDPSQTEDLWGKIIDTQPEVFFASDISPFVKLGFMKDLNLIISELGNYGPLEWWVLGKDINAAYKLAELYCERRVNRKQETFSPNFYYESCLAKMMYPNHNVSDQDVPSWIKNNSGYIGDFEKLRSVNPPSLRAGLTGRREWGIHTLTSSLPWLYEQNQYGSKENYTSTIFHEYLHVVQSANLYTTETFVDEVNNTVRVGWGPTSIVEGAADYVSYFLLFTFIKDGKYIKSPSFDYNLRDVMRSYMISVQDMLKNCPNFKLQDLNYGNICSPYEFGAWGVAYLLNKIDNQYAMQELFWPNINELGYYPAFEMTFGLTFDEFNDEFHEFLKLSIEEQILIIPDL